MVSQIREIIDVLHKEGVAILLVEQNVPLTLQASQRIYIMEKGAVRHTCAASDIKVDDPLIKQYWECEMESVVQYFQNFPFDLLLIQTVNGIVTA